MFTGVLHPQNQVLVLSLLQNGTPSCAMCQISIKNILTLCTHSVTMENFNEESGSKWVSISKLCVQDTGTVVFYACHPNIFAADERRYVFYHI